MDENIAKAGEYVQELGGKLGRKPLCCVTTFGCQMNIVHEKESVKII